MCFLASASGPWSCVICTSCAAPGPRIVEQAYWPTVQMVIWGLVTRFFVTNSSWVTEAAGVLIAAVFLWDPVPIHFQGRES